jgi:hypothetical protein
MGILIFHSYIIQTTFFTLTLKQYEIILRKLEAIGATFLCAKIENLEPVPTICTMLDLYRTKRNK